MGPIGTEKIEKDFHMTALAMAEFWQIFVRRDSGTMAFAGVWGVGEKLVPYVGLRLIPACLLLANEPYAEGSMVLSRSSSLLGSSWRPARRQACAECDLASRSASGVRGVRPCPIQGLLGVRLLSRRFAAHPHIASDWCVAFRNCLTGSISHSARK